MELTKLDAFQDKLSRGWQQIRQFLGKIPNQEKYSK